MSIKRIGVGPRMSQAVIHGNTVYLAGQVADKPVPSFGKQTKQILGQIDKLYGAPATTRNWNTITAILRILKGQGNPR